MSDIHGNLPALQAVADSLPQSETVVVAGDHCADGPCPAQVVDLLQELGWTLIMGNTDRDVVEDNGGKSAAWTREQLGAKRLGFLSQLDFSVTLDSRDEEEAQGVAWNEAILVVHANPLNLEDQLHPTMSEEELRPYLEKTEEEIVAFGHLHTPYVRPVFGKLLVDVSSVGHPKDQDVRAGYTVVKLRNGARSVDQTRLPYDIEKTLHLIKRSGMPAAEKQMKALLKASY
jgi:predicted phosphodiesterase